MGNGYLQSIHFVDKKGLTIEKYDPGNRAPTSAVFDIQLNEDIIGFYGVRDDLSRFTSFGFMVK